MSNLFITMLIILVPIVVFVALIIKANVRATKEREALLTKPVPVVNDAYDRRSYSRHYRSSFGSGRSSDNSNLHIATAAYMSLDT